MAAGEKLGPKASTPNQPKALIPRKPEQVCGATPIQAWNWGRYFCLLYLPQIGCREKQEEISQGGKKQKNQHRFKRQPTGFKLRPGPRQLCPLGNDSPHLSLCFHHYRIGQQAEPGQAVIGQVTEHLKEAGVTPGAERCPAKTSVEVSFKDDPGPEMQSCRAHRSVPAELARPGLAAAATLGSRTGSEGRFFQPGEIWLLGD